MVEAHEPCAVCGQETAVGSRFFFDRRVVAARRGTTYVCEPCADAEATRHRRVRLTGAEMTRFVNDANLMFKVGDH